MKIIQKLNQNHDHRGVGGINMHLGILTKKKKKKGGEGGINYALIFYHVDDHYFKFNHISFTAHRLFSVLSAIVPSHNLVYIFYS